MTDLEKVREIRKLFGKEKDKWLTPEELAYVDELCAIATSALERCEDYRQQLLKQGKRLEDAEEIIEGVLATTQRDMDYAVKNSHITLDEWCGSVEEMLEQFDDDQIVTEPAITKSEIRRFRAWLEGK